MEIQSVERLDAWLRAGRPVGGLRLQDLDLTSLAPRLRERDELGGLVVLGGVVPPALLVHLQRCGAVVFPSDPDVPVTVYRSRLYTGRELYAGLDGPGGYAATPDCRAYEWGRDMRLASDAYATLLKAIHDDSITDALDESVFGRRVVGVMGGHAEERGSSGYAAAAHLGRALAAAGLLVATGGGPGAMEAANLGAVAPTADAVEEALDGLRQVPSFRPDVDAWARLALQVADGLGSQAPLPPSGSSLRSLGVPTWFYGHEPPNVFAQAIAKYFSNAVREDGLLARCNAGVVVLPGAAGTVQEVFQLATRLYYAPAPAALPPLALVGVEYWTRTLPVWPLLQALAGSGPMAAALHLVDSPQEALALVSS